MTDTQSNDERPVPIFVIGMNRSGTKWLSNILCNHTEIAGVQSVEHTGILETNMFGTMPRLFRDLRPLETYIAMVELWSQTDFFKSSGAQKRLFYRKQPHPRSCADAFRLLMDQVANREASRFWLQKVSPLDIDPYLGSFPDARLVIIRRDMISTLESRIQLRRNRGAPMSLMHAVFLHAIQSKILDRIAAERDVMSLTYETLRSDPAGTIHRLCKELEIPFQDGILDVTYRKNTSFSDRSHTRNVFPRLEKTLALALAAALSIVPLRILHWIRAWFRTPSPTFVSGTFREIERHHELSQSRSSAYSG